MSDGKFSALSRRDNQSDKSKTTVVPGRLDTFARGYDSEELITSQSNQLQSLKHTETTPRNQIPTLVTSGTEGSKSGATNDTKAGPTPHLVTRSSFKRIETPGHQPRASKVHPILPDSIVRDASERQINPEVDAGTLRIPLQKGCIIPNPLDEARVTRRLSDPSRHRTVFLRTKKETEHLFVLPPVSLWGSRFNLAIFILIAVGFIDLAMKTCDGPNLGSTDPGYPNLPSETFHAVNDGLFAILFTVEFLGRSFKTGKITLVLRDPYMWFDFIGLSPWYIVQLTEAFKVKGIEQQVNLLRLVRTMRLAHILRHYEQTKIICQAIKASLRPLSITMFFLFTFVMALATAIYFVEPCFNVETCTFTDIFNTAYFVMVTVATVGYGSQVPSLKNSGSLLLTMIAMILGQIYFSMPVAIIGNNFELTYESFQMDKKKKKAQLFDASLTTFTLQQLHTHARRLCDLQYQLVTTWVRVHNHILDILRSATQSMPLDGNSPTVDGDYFTRIQQGLGHSLHVHGEAVKLLQVFIPHQRKALPMGLTTNAHGVLGKMFVKAKKAMTKTQPAHDSVGRDPSTASETLRGRIWLLLEVPHSSRLASLVNHAIVSFALISVMLFFSESLRELAASGVETRECKAVVQRYCGDTGLTALDPACFLHLPNGTCDMTQPINFACTSHTDSRTCYGKGVNFGSLDASALACSQVFLPAGADRVCYCPQCRAAHRMIFDMGPYWIYFEWWFGIVFTLELVLRFYVSRNRKHFWRNAFILFDVVAIVPFLGEVLALVFAQIRPDYAIVATKPSFLSFIRVLKILRILKLTRHFRGTKVLALTAMRIWKPLVIPLFFLFTGCIITGALFYEIERGKECFVGKACLWWNKNVLTPELARNLPIGKRILIQDSSKAVIIDMIHSTWLSYTTLTSVGYGDHVPRTSLGKFFDIFVIIVATIYSAMPLSLVGKQFYALYEKHMEKMIVKQGGSSLSWRHKNSMIVLQYKQVTKHPSARKPEPFALSQEHLALAHEFKSMKRTIVNLQRSLDATSTSSDDVLCEGSASKGFKIAQRSLIAGQRTSVRIDPAMELKSIAIMDTLMRFSQVVGKLQEAPVDFEAFKEDAVDKVVRK